MLGGGVLGVALRSTGGIMGTESGVTICVFVDALGWELVRQCGFMDDVLTHRSPLGTIFGYSSTCDPTILTGKLPREHGHFAFYYYNPAESPFRYYRYLAWLPKRLFNRGRVRARLSLEMKRLHGFTGYFQLYNMPFRHLHLFDYSERRDIYQPDGINSGAPTIFGVLRERGIPISVSDWHLPEFVRVAALHRDLEEGQVRFAFLFLSGLDAVLHAHGTQAQEVKDHLSLYEKQLRLLIEKAESVYGSVRMFVFSDHGMTDITQTVDLMKRIESLGLEFGVDYAAVYDSTVARFWFLREGSRKAIIRALKQSPEGRIVSDKQLADWGCDFSDKKYGQLFFLLNSGMLLCPSFMGEKPLAAMHGYAPEDPCSVASFMGNVPLKHVPKRLDDLYGLMYSEAVGSPEAP